MSREITVPAKWVTAGCALEFREGFRAGPDAENPVRVHEDTFEYDRCRWDAWEAGWRAAGAGRRKVRLRGKAA